MKNFRTTTVDFIILGLLQEQTLTGYGIRMIFENTAIGSYSSSPGTVYPAINKLKKMGFIKDIIASDYVSGSCGSENLFAGNDTDLLEVISGSIGDTFELCNNISEVLYYSW